jgi:signal transduction histidine kinase
MLTFDKIDENKLVIEVGEVNPWFLVRDVMKPFQINARDAGVILKTECLHSQTDWFNKVALRADKFKLNQVLRNFVSNALKFTPTKGTVTVTVEMKRFPLVSSLTPKILSIISGSNLEDEKLNDGIVRVSVKDTGCGISKENQKRLFGQYVQFNAGALQQGKGSGLGLWIAKSKIVYLFQFLN